jgi:3-methyladenine DNA glycosylase AlkD
VAAGPGSTPLASEVVARLEAAFARAADPVRAVPMAAYMGDQFAFYGIATAERRRLTREALRDLPRPDEADAVAVAWRCWQRDRRELQYVGGEYLCRHIAVCGPGTLGPLELLITTKSWWDTVDVLCRAGAGALVRVDLRQRRVMDRWLDSPNIWLARSAILHQERWGADMDPEVLFAYCLRRAGDREFFIRKAIGWALRSYAHVDAGAVRRFLAEHDAELSGLSKREALKRVRD